MCILVVILCRWLLWLMGLLEGVGGIWPLFLTSKKIPGDWTAAAAHEGGLSKSSCASHGARQEDVVKKSGCRASKIPEKKQHSWMQRGQNPWEKQHFWVQTGQHPCLVAASTGWRLYYLCFTPSTTIGPLCDRECDWEAPTSPFLASKHKWESSTASF